MISDELKELLASVGPDIATIQDYWSRSGNEQRVALLTSLTNQPDFWQHKDHITLSKEHQQLQELKKRYQQITTNYAEYKQLIELFGDDQTEISALRTDVEELCKQINVFKITLILDQEHDQAHCFISINAGAGGTESQDWASILLRMYLRFCEREDFAVSLLDYQAGDEAGIKSATLLVKGDNAYGLLKSESGIHRLVRISPFDANKRRHTSFAAVHTTPEVADEKVAIAHEDLRIDTYRAGGAGGQHVNKTDSAVRITHIPTGIVVQCQNERSQHQNKRTALKMLTARIAEKNQKEKNAQAQALQKQKKKIEWGSQIRSYVLHPYKMVKDHRTSVESSQPETVLDGYLMPFIEKYLITLANH